MEQFTLFGDAPAAKKSDRNEVTLLALASLKGVGFSTIRALCEEFRGDIQQVWTAQPDRLSNVLYDARTPNAQQALQEIKGNSKGLIAEGRKQWSRYRDQAVTVLFRHQDNYPSSLLDLPQPPSWLFVQGDVELLVSPFTVGVVGTRTPTVEGVEAARRASAHLTMMRAVIVSGLAEGIDSVAQQTSVVYGAPTIAVLGHGIDVVFPASTAKLRQELVLFGGAVVSEYLPRDNYSADKFVQRNRIQAALSRAVCFGDARERSGTAHTLRFAKQLHRPVFGVTSGPLRETPETELVRSMAAEGSPVFDMTEEQSVADLTEFIHRAFSQAPAQQGHDAPRLFRSFAQEIDRVAKDYHASREDLDYIIKHVQSLRKRLFPSESKGRKRGRDAG